MRLHLGGHLAWYVPPKEPWVEIRVAEPVLLTTLLAQLGVPVAEIAVAAVNGQAVPLEQALVSDADRVELFPPVGGGQ